MLTSGLTWKLYSLGIGHARAIEVKGRVFSLVLRRAKYVLEYILSRHSTFRSVRIEIASNVARFRVQRAVNR